MRAFLSRFLQVCIYPDSFFERVREEKGWSRPLLHLLALTLWLSLGSAAAWGLGVCGDTPLNSALGAQMDVYPFWRDILLPRYGLWSYPAAAGLVVLEMLVITAIWTPAVFVVFRYLGGAREPGGLLRAFQGFAYGLTPVAFGGFLPYLALVVGVYATLLQFCRGPAITVRNRTAVPYLFSALFMAFAISQYWQHEVL